MKTISFVPGAVATPNPITLPTGAPDIRTVVAAEIIRLGGALADHPAADVVGAIADHAVHAHDLVVGAAAVAAPYGASAGGNDVVDGAGELIAGGGATGVQDLAAAQVHVAGAGVLAHATGNPIVAATPTKITDTTFSLNVNTLVGDVLVLVYNEVGEFLRAS
jgi:hypothetical protein